MHDGYTIFGSEISGWHSATAVSTQSGGVMTYDTDVAFAKEFYNENRNVKDSGTYTYFGNTLRMLTLLYQTGNMPNLYTCTKSTTTTTTSTPPTTTPSTPSTTTSSTTTTTTP